MGTIKYRGQIQNGLIRLPGKTRDMMAAEIAQIKEGKWVEVTVRVLPKRSLQQQGYYFAVVVPMVMEALNSYGNEFDMDETHEFLKDKFNAQPVVNANSELIGHKGGSTTEMMVSEFMDYIANIQRWAAESLSLYIPDPNQQSQLNSDA